MDREARGRVRWRDKPVKLRLAGRPFGSTTTIRTHQVSVPAWAIRELGWETGTDLTVIVRGNELVYRPAQQ